jgi:HK97 gp10 family phage protein
MAKAELRGAGELIGKLKKNANLKDVKDVVRLNTSELQKGTQRNAAVDTGHLKRSIKQEILDNGFTGKVISPVEYAGYVEWGTRYMAAQPHVGPAFHVQKEQFKKDMKRLTE